MPSKAKEKTVGLGYIILAFVFLFNPNISVVDLLPDFIGYLLIYIGLAKIADIFSGIEDTRVMFRRLAWISAAKCASIFLIVMLPVFERETFGLFLTFSFAVLDLIFAIPAFGGLYEGLISLATRHGGKAVFYVKERKKKESANVKEHKKKKEKTPRPKLTETEKLKVFTIIFLLIKEILPILPELTSLSSYDNLGYVGAYTRDISEFRPLLRGMAFVAVLVFGIIWLCRSVSYFRRLKRDTEFWNTLTEYYNDKVLPNRNLFIFRDIKRALLILGFAFGLGVDFYAYNVNLIPDFLAAILFIIGFALLVKYTKKAKKSIIFAAIYGIVSLAEWIGTIYFNQKYDITYIKKSYDVYFAYRIVGIGALAETVVYILFMFSAFALLFDLIKNHTGYVGDASNAEYSSHQRKALQKELGKGLIYGLVFSVFSGITNVLYFALSTYVEYIWMINFAVMVICAVLWIKALNEINDEVENKYII